MDLAEALLAETSDSNFLPCPQISLFVDPQASLGCCGICQVTQLHLQSQDEGEISEGAVAILPCGHLGCHACLEKCLESKASCPFCRLSLEYELCRHSLRARVLTKENLLSAPVTIPMGGSIPDQCRDCRISTNRAANDIILKSLAESFQVLQKQYQSAGPQQRAAIGKKLQILQQQFEIVAKTLSSATVAALSSQW